jgi:hypothetical protein
LRKLHLLGWVDMNDVDVEPLICPRWATTGTSVQQPQSTGPMKSQRMAFILCSGHSESRQYDENVVKPPILMQLTVS